MSALKKIMTSAFAVLALSCCAAVSVAHAEADVKGSSDNALIGRYAGSWVATFKQTAFDEAKLLTGPFPHDDEKRVSPVWKEFSGKNTNIEYRLPPNSHSAVEVISALKENLAIKNAEILFECKNEACVEDPKRNSSFQVNDALNHMIWENFHLIYGQGKLGNNDVYFNISTSESSNGGEVITFVHAVEVKPMQTGQGVFVDSSAMEKSMNSTGKVTLYGIQFDFDKATIKSESKPTLDEIAKYLKKNADQKIAIVGYTDNKGGFAYNQDLSKRRADAVAAALASQYGIPADHMDPSGAGMASPVASNATEEGQAKNRRVELIKE